MDKKVVFTYNVVFPGTITIDDANSLEEYARERGFPERSNRSGSSMKVEVECDDLWDAAMTWRDIVDHFTGYGIDLPEKPDFVKEEK